MLVELHTLQAGRVVALFASRIYAFSVLVGSILIIPIPLLSLLSAARVFFYVVKLYFVLGEYEEEWSRVDRTATVRKKNYNLF